MTGKYRASEARTVEIICTLDSESLVRRGVYATYQARDDLRNSYNES